MVDELFGYPTDKLIEIPGFRPNLFIEVVASSRKGLVLVWRSNYIGSMRDSELVMDSI